jgi:hypothetical protein
MLAGVVGAAALPSDPAAATSLSSGGWTTDASANPATVARGTTLSLAVTVTSTTTRQALVDLEVYNAGGVKVFQQAWDNQAFTAGTQRSFTATWPVPAGEALNAHSVRVGTFSPGWGQLWHWNGNGASFTVTGAPVVTTTTTTGAPGTTTTTRAPATTTTTTTPPASGRFVTLPPRSALPTDAQCAARVRPAAEVRSQNATYNQTKGFGPPINPPWPLYNRVTGNFTGTTDEIIQWASCKWGIDEDIVRAQTAKESWWLQSANGDNGDSWGLMQVRHPYFDFAFNNDVGDAKTSSACNLDIALAARRNCFEGNETWLNTVPHTGTYAAGDLWGCVGTWFSGRWHDAPADQYMAEVKTYLSQRIWETPNFLGG